MSQEMLLLRARVRLLLMCSSGSSMQRTPGSVAAVLITIMLNLSRNDARTASNADKALLNIHA